MCTWKYSTPQSEGIGLTDVGLILLKVECNVWDIQTACVYRPRLSIQWSDLKCPFE
jgi:hypothetical protein